MGASDYTERQRRTRRIHDAFETRARPGVSWLQRHRRCGLPINHATVRDLIDTAISASHFVDATDPAGTPPPFLPDGSVPFTELRGSAPQARGSRANRIADPRDDYLYRYDRDAQAG